MKRKIPKTLRKFATFVAEDDIEVMTSALHPTSDLDKENKRMNRIAINRLNKVINKMDKNKLLNKVELAQLKEANEIYLSEGKTQAKKLNAFLKNK